MIQFGTIKFRRTFKNNFGQFVWIEFPLFPRNVQYRERLKGPLLSFFGFVRIFFKENPQRPPSIFRYFATKDVEKCERRPSSVVWVFHEFDTLFASLIR